MPLEDNNQTMAGVYLAELRLQSHTHRLEGEQKEKLEGIISELQDLRTDLQPTEFFGELD